MDYLENPWGRPDPNLKGRKLTSHEKSYLAQLVIQDGDTQTAVARRFGINKMQISRFVNKILSGSVFHEKSGAPPKLDDIASGEIVEALSGKRVQLSVPEYHSILAKGFAETAARLNRSPAQQRPPHRSTTWRFERARKILTDKNPEETTSARAKACADIRNNVSILTAFRSLELVLPQHKANFDATQFHVGDMACKKPAGKRVGAIPNGKQPKINKQAGRTGLTGFFIKSFVLITASGVMGPLVHCIASSRMSELDIDCHQVGELGVTCKAKDPTYIVFSKTRGMNFTFYRWYWTCVVIPFMKELREDSGDLDSVQFVACDGENAQISIFADPEFQQAMSAAKIHVDKPSASTTEYSQPLDCGTIFKTVKRYLAVVSDATVQHETAMLDTLAQVWLAHRIKCGEMTPDHQRMGIQGIMRVSHAFRQGWNSQRAKDSFAMTGQHPFDAKKVLSHCTTKLTPAEEKTIFASLPVLSEIYLAHGELTKQNFDACSIPDNTIGKPKEQLAISRQRTVRLTHPEVAAKLCEAMTRKRQKAATKAAKLPRNAKDSKPKKPYKPSTRRQRTN